MCLERVMRLGPYLLFPVKGSSHLRVEKTVKQEDEKSLYRVKNGE